MGFFDFIGNALFGKESKGAQPFRAPGYEQQFGALNDIALGGANAYQGYLNNYGANSRQSPNFGGMLGGVTTQLGQANNGVGGLFDFGNFNFNGLGQAGTSDPRFFTAGQNLPQIANTAQNLNPINFEERTPYQFNFPQFNLTRFDPQQAVGDAFSPLADRIESRLNRFSDLEREDITNNANRRGLVASGALNQALADQSGRHRDALSEALNQLAGQQASQQLAAYQFAPQMELQQQSAEANLEAQRQARQAEEIYRSMGANDDQVRAAADDAYRRASLAYEQDKSSRQLGLTEFDMQNRSLQQVYDNLLRLASLSSGGTPKQPGSTGLLSPVLGAAGKGFGGWIGSLLGW